MTLPFALLIRGLLGQRWPLPVGPVPGRRVTQLVADDLAEVSDRELAAALGISRQGAALRIARAAASGDYSNLLRPAAPGRSQATTTTGTTPAVPMLGAGAAAAGDLSTREKDHQ